MLPFFVTEADYTLDDSFWNDESPVGKWNFFSSYSSSCINFHNYHSSLFAIFVTKFQLIFRTMEFIFFFTIDCISLQCFASILIVQLRKSFYSFIERVHYHHALLTSAKNSTLKISHESIQLRWRIRRTKQMKIFALKQNKTNKRV